MKILSWNVNGLRAVHKKGFIQWLENENPDILGLQETKAEPEQLSEELRAPKGYVTYFDSSKGRKGYSGVALYSKKQPKCVIYGMGIKKFDTEGRMIEAHFDTFILLNVYFPNGGGGPERLQYKLDFYDAFLAHIERLRKHHKNIIFMGDVNTAHEEIDLARPKENEKNTGFLPEERAWIDEVIYHGWIDTFRHLHQHTKDAYSYWDMKTRARDRNVGWRIDYIYVSTALQKCLRKAFILADTPGSDHAPVGIDIVL
ncbi:MAG: exodeoxyribonuclease III [Candidatus Lloydbacteria bacterium CG22_combo_CG10-13_8_21_14_all_47_15]|uniref:Exodeoxyribonuclease III n=1 Tax=Candidatus Lloydbacteria bacterium CG22_combo_CG10-13_8_21_14_all_47_15 TaxID=1974635 RepID=A0A2H0CUR0_9BACT|nr:MAG: exodeoxyribonuclease III [Candidatus Lloydbacteria bacterium CG22_combo_CG10-13_8_21_14_all_47_15]